MTEPKSDAQAIIESVEKLSNPSTIRVEKGDVIFTPKGIEIRSAQPFLDEIADAPRRHRGTTEFTLLRSFADYVAKFKREHSAIYAQASHAEDDFPRLTAVLDHNEPDAPRFGEFRAIYVARLSDELRAWRAVAGKSIPQEAFAQFIEERALDFCAVDTIGPNAAKVFAALEVSVASPQAMMQLAKGLALRIEQKVTEQRNLSTGECQLRFSEEHTAEGGTPMRVPNGFSIAVPAFTGGPLYQIPVRLRYKVRQGQITWTLAPHGLEDVLRAAFDEACALAGEKTGLPVFHGWHP